MDRAQALPVPQSPKLKTPDQFRYIGKNLHRLDSPEKATGRGIYGMDVQVPGMLVASIERAPVVSGGKVQSFDATAAKAIPGVKHVVQVTNGIAVVADRFSTAVAGRRALKVTWDLGPMAQVSSAQISSEYAALSQQPGQVARKDGDVEKALAAGGRTLEAAYEVPFLEHACMEPMNATAQITPDGCVVWAPTQNPGGTQATAARIAGVPPEKVTVNTTLLGGGFGRRGEIDFIVDAVETAKAVGAPVKLMWTREDDIQHGFYRPATYNVFRAALDGGGMPVAWSHRIVGPGILAQKGRMPGNTTVDPAAVSGARDLPYDIPNVQVEWLNKDFGRAARLLALGRLLAERVHHRELHRRAGPPRPARTPSSTGGRCSASHPATRRCSSWPRRAPAGDRRCPRAARAASRWPSPTAATPRT